MTTKETTASKSRAWWAALLLRQHERYAPRLALALARWRKVGRRARRRAALAAAGAAVGVALTAGPFTPTAHAATIIANGTTCTLAEAITTANLSMPVPGCVTGSAGADVISLTADVLRDQPTTAVDYYYSRHMLPAIESTITIQGNGHTIARDTTGAQKFRLLTVTYGGDLTLNDLTLTGGYAFDVATPFYLGEGGAIFSAGTLTLNNVTITGNQSQNDGGGVFNLDSLVTINDSEISGNDARDGGGVYSFYGQTFVNDSAITGNAATDDGGGLYVYGYAGEGGELTVSRSTIANNTADYSGGGIYAYDAIVAVDASTISGNTTIRDGGGVYGQESNITITQSTVAGNKASDGAGVYSAASVLTMTNSTVSGNEAYSDGAGIFAAGGEATLTHVTISNNYAEDSGGGLYGGAYDNISSTITLVSTIISGNIAGSADEVYRDDGDSTIVADADNVFAHDGLNDDEAFAYFSPGASDVNASTDGASIGLTSILEPLADNGGPTDSHALPDGSPALDLAAAGPATDQRDWARPFGSGFDAGALEMQPPPSSFVFISDTTARAIGPLAYTPGDILKWDGGAWTKWFDAAAAGLGPKTDVSAMWIPDATEDEVVLGFNQKFVSIPAANRRDNIKVGRDQLVWYDGEGFTLWFNGAKAAPKEFAIDAVHVLDGSLAPGDLESAAGGSCQYYLLLSMAGSGSVPHYNTGTIKFRDEDVLGFCMSQSGQETRGKWIKVIDGAAEGMPANSANGLSASEDGETIYVTTVGPFVVDTAAGGHSMVYAYDVATGTFSGPLFSAPANGFNGKVDAVEVSGELD